jgi:hypothetical protein
MQTARRDEALLVRVAERGYRDDGWGRAAHDPAMMVASR